MIAIGLLFARMLRDFFKPRLASQGFHGLLAMEIPLARGPAADRPRGTRPDPKNEF
jgi:hypothetical protein